MFKAIGKTFFSAFFLILSSAANATLITNGSFEQLSFTDHSESVGQVFNTNLQAYEQKSRVWDVFYALPGWSTILGHGMELQKNVVTHSQDGLHHLELDSHPRSASNAVIAQTLDALTIGSEYLLEFYYKPRTNLENDNGINVYWYDGATDFNLNMQTSFVSDSTRRATPNWISQSVVLTAQAESMVLSFGSFGNSNTLGGLIDNVSLNQVSAVPEPSTFALALLGLIAIRRRKQFPENI